MYINLCIDSCIKESNKRELIEQSQACCDEKCEISIHAILTNGFYSWLDIFEEYLRCKKVLLQGFMELRQKEETYTYGLHIGLIV